MILKKRTIDNEQTRLLSSNLGIDNSIAGILVARGIDTLDAAKDFLFPDNKRLPVFGIPNMDKAVERIKTAVVNSETILIYGDYDCDGICAVTILKLYFESIGAKVCHHIPLRADGYGLSLVALENVVEKFMPDLIITVDCGITAVEEVEYCYEALGVDIIITDHHEPCETLPECIIINPKLDAHSPLRDICGAGVALKLVEALDGYDKAMEYVDIACIATIADVVPLVGENRKIVALGLKKMNEFERPGIKLLAKSINIDKLQASDIGYRIAPRLNASARMGNTNDILPIFTSNEYFELESLVAQLNNDNEKRQTLTNKVYCEAMQQLKSLKLEHLSVIVLHCSSWESGVLGLVAARLAQEFFRPAILLNSKNEFCRGSARSISGINIFQCLNACSNLLTQYGGHEGAGGLTINIAKLEQFKENIDKYIKDTYPQSLFEQVVEYDIEITDKRQIDKAFYKQLELLEPTGEGNPPAVLLLNSNIAAISRIGNTKHVKIKLNREAEAVAFNA
ncbi:MAG: single-stranded-DNA-specific exonuclease RecJ, partial [Clostridia bacterium]|nr:single-stranded-DNA-specific exonuclease RecJ [Clostridia bacterium]